MKKFFLILSFLSAPICTMEQYTSDEPQIRNNEFELPKAVKEFRKRKRPYQLIQDLLSHHDDQIKKQKIINENLNVQDDLNHNAAQTLVLITNADWENIRKRTHKIQCECGIFNEYNKLNFWYDNHYRRCSHARTIFNNYKESLKDKKDLKAYCTTCNAEVSDIFYYQIHEVNDALNKHCKNNTTQGHPNKLDNLDFFKNLGNYIKQYKIS